MKNQCLIFIFLIISSTLFSQKKAMNNWIFGDSFWIDFNVDPVSISAIQNPGFLSQRSTVSESDINGNLLFYAIYLQVYNREHNVMPNGTGLMANANGTNPVFAIPKPNSSTNYYLLTNSQFIPSGGLFWSEIDMNLDNGLGDINANKNIQLTNSCTGKITAVRHANLVDIWIVSHNWDSNTYDVWLATENGISSIPVTSNVGSIIEYSNLGNGFGQIKTSPDGTMIASANQHVNTVEIFDFDRSTGLLSNPKILESFSEPYGVEFSPNGKYLYVSQDGNFQFDGLMQFDLEAGNANDISNSGFLVGLSSIAIAGGLQIGPNGKIYSVNDIFGEQIGVINQPNEAGVACDFDQIGFFTPTYQLNFGLPCFFHDYFEPSYFSSNGFCFGTSTDFNLTGFSQPIDSVLWDFGDPNSASNNSTQLNPTHQFSASGFFDVQITIFSNGTTVTNNQEVYISGATVDVLPDQFVCENEIYTANTFIPNAAHLWSTNETGSAINISTPGEYWVEITVGNCNTVMDTFNISHLSAPAVDLGDFERACFGDTEIIMATDLNPDATYLWNDGSTNSNLEIVVEGDETYSVTVSYPNGCTDSDDVLYSPIPMGVIANHANLSCFENESGVANAIPQIGDLPFTYLWNTGDTIYTINGLNVGTYTLTVTDVNGCTLVEEYEISQPPEFSTSINVIDDDPLTMNPEGEIFINPSGGTPPYTIELDTFGVFISPISDLSSGVYNIIITDDNDCEILLEVIVGGGTNSLEKLSFLEKIEIFPNPTSEMIFIKKPKKGLDDFEFLFYNSLGQLIPISFFEKNKDQFVLDVNDLESGVYFIEIKKGENRRLEKVIVF